MKRRKRMKMSDCREHDQLQVERPPVGSMKQIKRLASSKSVIAIGPANSKMRAKSNPMFVPIQLLLMLLLLQDGALELPPWRLAECLSLTPDQYDGQFMMSRTPGAILFPAGSQAARPSSPIYVNPQPSTSSGRGRAFEQQQQQQQQTSNKMPRGPLTQSRPPSGGQSMRIPSSAIGSTPSSIGKSERQQVAEWPFFKSLQSARTAGQQQALLSQQASSLISDQMRTNMQIMAESTTSSAELPATSTTTTQAPPSSSTRMPATSSPSAKSTTASSSTTATSTTTSSSSSSRTATSSTTTPASVDDEETEPEDEQQEGVTSRSETAPLAGTNTRSPSGTTVMVAREQIDQATPVFSPNYHAGIQTAVNRLYEMGASAGAAAADKMVRLNGQAEVGAKNGSWSQRGSGSSSSSSSSLSLNVMLKNFGALNLSSLDQILLKSNLNGRQRNRTQTPLTGHSQSTIAINGIHLQTPSSGNSGSSQEDTNTTDGSANATSLSAAAECKIEYTMQHVNISLVNDDKSNYTCDYIIDRKMNLTGAGQMERRICKLHLVSRFFANESSDTQREGESPCAGLTHLAIGKMHFCYLPQLAGDHQLNRVFAFPIGREAFDIRLVHKGGSNASQAIADEEIHLEIRPVLEDADCEQLNSSPPMTEFTGQPATADQLEPLMGVDEDGENVAGTSELKPLAPLTNASLDDKSRSRQKQIASTRKKSKFVLKVTPERQLHPLNNLVRDNKPLDGATGQKMSTISQNFDVTMSNNKRQGSGSNEIIPAINDENEESLPLCSEVSNELIVAVHTSTVGQLTTPNYPANYSTNTRCRYLMKRVSLAYCQLLLHFRDFDLVGGPMALETLDCHQDYLQIGKTRYCNRYAMIGHRMYLNYSAVAAPPASELPVDETITLVFNSDAHHTGRGFLVKYQQLLCAGQSADKSLEGANLTARKLTSNQETPTPARLQTLAPPLEQPDFGLALRTSGKPSGRGSGGGGGGNVPSATNQKGRQIQTPNQQAGGELVSRKQSAPALQAASSSTSGSISTLAPPGQLQADQTTGTASISKRASVASSYERQCNRVNSELSFYISSPNYPDEYVNNAQCLFYVRRNNSRVCYLELTFVHFDLEPDQDCRYDFFEINNVRLCGSLRHHQVVTDETTGPTKHSLHTTRIYLFEEAVKLMKFKSDALTNRAGFLIRVDQLECARNGSIVRAETKPIGARTSWNSFRSYDADNRTDHTDSVPNKMFEYDSNLLDGSGESRNGTNASTSTRVRKLTAARQRQTFLSDISAPATDGELPGKLQLPASGCDDLFYGSQMTIKSPNWPESYTSDDSITSCRYTIVRSQPPLVASRSGSSSSSSTRTKMVCQLELRFVHLRLSFTDCLDIGGLELLCGFNSRNLVKYYPFNERQTHLTITFSTNAAAKFARQITATNGTELPGQRLPHRFMIIARQLECIDDFLAPQVELEPEMSPNQRDSSPLSNATNLLYASEGVGRLADRPRYANRSQLTGSPIDRRSGNGAGLLMYSFANSLKASEDGAQKVKVKVAQQADRINGGHCLVQLSQYNGILSGSQILARLESRAPSVGGEAKNELFNYNKPLNECEIRLKLLPGYCKIQLTFGEFDLYPPRRQSLCLGERLELAGVEYCGQELRNATRLLATTLPNQRHISLRAMLAGAQAFRAIFKQLECESPTLLSPQVSTQDKPETGKVVVGEWNPLEGTNLMRPKVLASSTNESRAVVELREFALRDEFFELNSEKVSKLSRLTYDPNLFVIYKLHRANPLVCRVRLMFYNFELEAESSEGACKRDFLDINNADRLCGSLNLRSSEASREYDWPQSDQHFQISFVTDSSVQRAGFHIFGQQLSDSASCGQPQVSSESPPPPPSSPPSQPQPPTQPPVVEKSQASERHKFSGQTLERERARLPANCSLIIDDLNFELASTNWPRPYAARGICHYLIRRAPALAENICSLTLRVNSMILDLDQATSSGDEPADEQARGLCDHSQDLRNTDYLELDGGQVRLCGLMARPRTFTFDFMTANRSQAPRQFIMVKFVANVAKGFGFHIEGQQNKCPSASGSQQEPQPLVTYDDRPAQSTTPPASSSDDKHELREGATLNGNSKEDGATGQSPLVASDDLAGSCNKLLTAQVNLLESGNFPNLYEHNQNCLVAIRRANQSVCAIDLVFNYFDLDQANAFSGLCETDYLELDYSRFCGSYPAGHKLRFHYYDQELDKLLRFRTDASLARNGFSLMVKQVTDCVAQEDSARMQEPPTSSSLPDGTSEHDSTTDQKQRESQNKTAGQRELISYLPDDSQASSSLEPNSPKATKNNNNKTQLQPREESPGGSSTLCQFVYHSQRQLLVSPNFNVHRRHYDNNLDCQYKIVAANYDVCALRLTFLELELEQSPDCANDYLLIDSRRYCGKLGTALASGSSSQNGSSQGAAENKSKHMRSLVIELEFSATLPREIDLIFHTNARVNSGRGFKLLSEQVACNQQSPPVGQDQEEFRASPPPASRLDAESVARARQVRRLRFGQLNYPKNYVSSSSSTAQKQPDQGHDLTRHTSRLDQQLESEAREMRLMSKEIVVARAHQPASVN